MEAEHPTYLCKLPGDGHHGLNVQLSAAPSTMTQTAAATDYQPRGDYREF